MIWVEEYNLSLIFSSIHHLSEIHRSRSVHHQVERIIVLQVLDSRIDRQFGSVIFSVEKGSLKELSVGRVFRLSSEFHPFLILAIVHKGLQIG